jgi:hypothetical protein
MLITGQPEQVRVVMDSIRGWKCTENALFDLNSIVAMPEPVKISAELTNLDVIYEIYGAAEIRKLNQRVEEAQERCLAETGFMNWREWAFEHWGAASNVCDVVECEPGALRFRSEYSPIAAALRTLTAKFKDIEILLEYVDSCRAFVGFSIFIDGHEDNFLVDWCSADARDIRRRLDCIDDAVDEGDDMYPPPSEYIN